MSRFRSRDSRIAIARPASTNGAASRTCVQRDASRPPASQKIISRWAPRSAVNSTIAEMIEARNALTATPASSSTAIEKRPPAEATANTSARAPAAPANAMAGSASGVAACAPMAIATTAPSAPPVDTSDDAGVGHRVPEQALHHGARRAPGPAPTISAMVDARQPDRLDDGALGIGGLKDADPDLLQQDAGRVGERDGVRSRRRRP